MPTENRSSNTEMVSVPREWLNSVALLQMPLDELQEQAIQHLCEPCDEPSHQPHPDPIAWMVGTAFWWTKEEAERDAAETGLPIVGLGPMAGISPAEQHQDRPVVIQCPLCSQTHEQVPVGRVGGQLADSCDVDFTTWRCGGCYGSWSGDPGDAGEVERLQLEIEKLRLSLTLNDDALIQDGFVRIENRSLRDRLAEQEKLLREIKTARDWNGSYWALGKRIDTALSTSAEPSTLPDPLCCNECTHADCGKFDGPRQVECRAMADNACARPGASS